MRAFKTDEGITCEVELPGYSKEDVQVSLGRDSIMEIVAENKVRGRKSLRLNIAVGVDIDISKTHASVENGLLTLKFIESKPISKQIPIQ